MVSDNLVRHEQETGDGQGEGLVSRRDTEGGPHPTPPS